MTLPLAGMTSLFAPGFSPEQPKQKLLFSSFQVSLTQTILDLKGLLPQAYYSQALGF